MIVSTTEKFRADLIKWLNENIAFSKRVALDHLIPFEEADEDVQERIIEIMNSSAVSKVRSPSNAPMILTAGMFYKRNEDTYQDFTLLPAHFIVTFHNPFTKTTQEIKLN